MEGASERTVTSDRICFDSLPPQYSAHEGFFLLSGNKPIPGHTGHKLQNLPAPYIRRGFSLSALASVCLLVRCEAVTNLPLGFWQQPNSRRHFEVFKQIDSTDQMHITHCFK